MNRARTVATWTRHRRRGRDRRRRRRRRASQGVQPAARSAPLRHGRNRRGSDRPPEPGQPVTAGSGGVPPGPCRAELQFLDGDGNVLASRRVRLEAGHAAFLDFTPAFVPINTNGDAVAPLRAEIRASVNVGRRRDSARSLPRDAGDFRQRDGANDGASCRQALPFVLQVRPDVPPGPCRTLLQELEGQ